jgi:O-methyltransferase
MLEFFLGAFVSLGLLFGIVLAAILLYSVRKGTYTGRGVPVALAIDTQLRPSRAEELYLDLMKRVLTRALIAGTYERHTLRPTRVALRRIYDPVSRWMRSRGYELVRLRPADPQGYLESGHEAKNRLEDAETMVGILQLDNLQSCIEDVLHRDVPGDLLEAGVWRGGVTVFMRAALKVYASPRRVWVVDSFEGLPTVNKEKETYDWQAGQMAVSLEEVRANFARYGLDDDQVRFLKGFFHETLPNAPIDRLAVLRVDADLYQSTMDAITHLYPKLSIGGYAIFDDYQNLPDCRRAIDEYRRAHGISEEIRRIDSRAVYWRRES